MGWRELHKYEFTCDGRTLSGGGYRQCLGLIVTQGFNPVDAEPGGWDYIEQGWLCDKVHYNDPRYPV